MSQEKTTNLPLLIIFLIALTLLALSGRIMLVFFGLITFSWWMKSNREY